MIFAEDFYLYLGHIFLAYVDFTLRNFYKFWTFLSDS